MSTRVSRRFRVLVIGAAVAIAGSLLGVVVSSAAAGTSAPASTSASAGTSAPASTSAQAGTSALADTSAPAGTAAKSATTTSVRVSPAAITVGAKVTLSATVKSSTAKRPTGTVTFKAGTAKLCAAKLSASASASATSASASAAVARCTAKITIAGKVTIIARYGGDAKHAASSGSAKITAARAASKLTLAISPLIIAAGGTAALSAQVSSAFRVPSGTVTFADAKGKLCAVKLAKGAAACRRAFTALGTYRITAKYGADSTHTRSSASAKLIVAQGETATAVSVSASTAPAETATTFSATVRTSDGNPTGPVVFSIGATALCSGTLAGGAASCRGSYPTPGKYTVTATYAGDASFYGSFGSLSWTVTTIPTTVTVTTTGSPTAIPEGTAATLTASVGPAASPAPTGTATFSQGATVICASVPLTAGGTASCVTPVLAALGTDQVTVAYSGTALYAPSSGALTLTVVPSLTSVQACVNVGTLGKVANVGVTLTLVTPTGATTAQTVGTGTGWLAAASNCPGNSDGQQIWTLNFPEPVATSALTAAASYLQVASTTQSAWHGQFELFTGAGTTLKSILTTRPNMYYNEKSTADPCGYDESINTYQFPLTTTSPGTCGTPTGLNT